ncbi:parkin coregulated gene protein homolog [Arctopsyche grandis]|uniref:parkin coregulated gene protein homolog n=1 Tax=Arctopsyche grandis TaxID=121162 RepID=UPI00406DA325
MIKKCKDNNESTGKEFRITLRKPLAGTPAYRNPENVRIVPAFTIQSLQRNVQIEPPPSSGIFEPKPPKDSHFKKAYLRGEFPIAIDFDTFGKHICWKVPIEKLDFHHYLPIFFDGLVETDFPFSFFAQEGIKDMVRHGAGKVLPVIPQLIIPIKNSLNTKREEVICNVLKAVQNLVISCDRVGEALVPYYRQILPIFNLFKERNLNLGEGVDRTENVGSLIDETLQLLERYGGEDAFINIKYMVPTYESCVLN